MTDHLSKRLLALDLRVQRYGYAAFDCLRLRLLGWGFQRHALRREMTTQKHLARLQSRFGFGQILIRWRVNARFENRQRDLVGAVLRFGSLSKVPISVIDPDEIRRFFNGKPKYEIAKLVADRFPEIAWKLPPKRKPWEPESEQQSIFDAISVGLYFFESQIESRMTTSPGLL